MSLGLISGYGSDSDGEGDQGGYQVFLPTGESVGERLRALAAGAGLQGTGGVALPTSRPPPPSLPTCPPPPSLPASLALPPPPPPPANPYVYQPQPQFEDPTPLPNPMRNTNRTKKKKVAGIGRKEMEMLKLANFTDIVTADLDGAEGDRVEFDYNTPLPFDPAAMSGGALPGGPVHSAEAEDAAAYNEEYKNYLANSAGLLEGQAQQQAEAGEAARAAAANMPAVQVVLWWKGDKEGEEDSHKSVAVAGEFNSWHPENGGECVWEEIKSSAPDRKVGCQTCSRESHREGTECPGLLADKCFVCEKPGHFEGAPVCSGIKPEKKGTDDAPHAQDLAAARKKKKKFKLKRKGAWIARLQLQPGRYLYKFVVDGNWLVNTELQVSEVHDTEGQEYNQVDVEPPAKRSENVDEWTEYYEKYSEWYAQYGDKANPLESAGPKVEAVQKTFEELLQQDKEVENYFKTGPANEYNTQRDAFKSSFRGTRMYRMRNGEGPYNAKHFNGLSLGAKAMKDLYPRQKQSKDIVDHDAYVDEKDLPENQDPKSMKQRKKDKWFEGMVKRGQGCKDGIIMEKGCKKCGFVFCRCHGWEYKPRHCK